MRKALYLLLMMGFIATSLSSCLKDNCNREVTYIKPISVFKTYEEIRVPVTTEPAQEMVNPGKIFAYGNYLFVNEYLKGIHVIDNSNPANPTNISFISVTGSIDISIKENILYTDNYTDLLALDISNINNVVESDRIQDAFKPMGMGDNNTILVGVIGESVTEKVDCNWSPDPSWRLLSDSNDPSIGGTNSSSNAKDGANISGTAGSMAQFAVVDKNLYVIDGELLYLFDISTAAKLNSIGEVTIGQGIETLFPYEDKLFIGANDGMYIYDNTNPTNPVFLSKFEHVTACDPVVVDGDYAYVTLRNDNECGSGWRNEMQVINIEDPSDPFLVMEQSNVSQPKGVAVADQKIYLCDGWSGIKVYDHQVSEEGTFDTDRLIDVQTISGIDAYDAIALPDQPVLLVVGTDGIYQYQRAEDGSLTLLSQLSIQ